jgi:hypothetical protein
MTRHFLDRRELAVSCLARSFASPGREQLVTRQLPSMLVGLLIATLLVSTTPLSAAGTGFFPRG